MDWTVSVFLGAVAVSALLVVRTWLQNRKLRGDEVPLDGSSSPGASHWNTQDRRHDRDEKAGGGDSSDGGGSDGGGD